MSYSALHNHSEYSVLDGFSHPIEYLQRASEIGLKAFAITEHGNQYSWVYFDKLKNEFPDLKMIYGVELYECFDINIQDKNNKYFHLVALAKNENGRIALNNIITRSNLEGFYYKPRVDLNILKPYANDLIILTACLASKIARENCYEKCIEYIEEYKNIFPHFYLEMQSHDTEDQIAYNNKILQLSIDTNTEFVITTDAHAATKEDLYYQARHVQIAHDDDTLTEVYSGCYLQTEDEIHEIMDKQIGFQNVSLGLANTNKVSDLIDVVDMPFQDPQLPTFPLPDGFNDNYTFLKHLTEKGWYDRGIDKRSDEDQQIRQDRLKYELGIIHQMHYDGYFLFVWDFINYAKENNIAIGDGRGSGGGSIVNYLIGITELDPIDNDLIFERFLNPERVSMPDIDVDVADRSKIVSYLTNKYGEEKVCQIINFNYITPIVAIKDVGRVLGIPYNVCDKISKKFTYETFDECIENNPKLIEEYIDYKDLFDIASKLSGRLRNVSTHAGGVGIVDTEINDYMGMKLDDKGGHVIQVDKKKIEEIGIIKFDILGLSNLTIISEVMHDVGLTAWDMSINNPAFFNDTAMYELLASARTNGVFQVESSGMKDLLLRLKPTNLEDVSAVLALYRPDTMSMLEDYIHYKHNPEDIEYWHTDMIPVLNKTYGCIIYQEELMDIVRVFGGRTYGGADKFRKGIGKKDKNLVKKEASKLYEEIVENNYEEQLAKKISEYMALMGGYCFNKSHSALYSVITLKTAYLKAHYPAYFFKALLNQNKNDYGTLNKYIIDAKEFGIEILPPHINKSEKLFSVEDEKIRFGFEAIKGIGTVIVDHILNIREDGKYQNYEDFVSRTYPSKSTIISLVKAGAIPVKNKKRFLMDYAQSLFEWKPYKEVVTLPKLSILKEKFNIDTDIIKDKSERLSYYNMARNKLYNIEQQEKFKAHMKEFEDKYLQNEQYWEFDALSIFITNNPFEKAYEYLTPFEDVENGTKGVVVGIVANVTKKKDRHGKQFAFVSIYSAYGLFEVTVWHSQFKAYQDLLVRGQQLTLLCKKNDDKAIVVEIKTYDKWLKDRKIIM